MNEKKAYTIRFDADLLKLYRARDDRAWLNSNDDDFKALERREIPDRLNDDAYFGKNFEPAEHDIHVLVENPEDPKEFLQYKNMYLLRLCAQDRAAWKDLTEALIAYAPLNGLWSREERNVENERKWVNREQLVLDENWQLNDDAYFGQNFKSASRDIHVLVEKPKDPKVFLQYKNEKWVNRLRVFAVAVTAIGCAVALWHESSSTDEKDSLVRVVERYGCGLDQDIVWTSAFDFTCDEQFTSPNWSPMESATSAFAVPRRLFAGHKRRVGGSNSVDSSAFFTRDDYDAFSVHGDAHESRLYAELETRRRTLVTTITSCKNIRNSSPAMEIKHQSKHLVQILVEAIANGHIEAPEKVLELDNARRRVSGFSVAEHERYLLLQRKLVQAQQVQNTRVFTIASVGTDNEELIIFVTLFGFRGYQRGLPEVLALSQDEAKQWQQMKADVEKEQIGFCRMMTRGLAAEAAANEALIPSFADSWFNAMLTQCWNDIYRLYPRWFEPCAEMTLPSGENPADSCSAVIKAKEVAARGSCCAVDLRRLVAGQPVTNGGENGGLADVVSPRLAISADTQAAQLMDEYDCHLAISSSTLVTLFDSDTSTRFAHVPVGWGIPMKSRTNAHGTCGATKKRIFLDRPLPGNSPSTREKVAEAGRAALLSRFETESVIEGSTGGRTTYHVWELDDKRILVRGTAHVALANTGESNNLATAPLSVFVKPDYHSLRTEEQLTTSERCRFWLHSWLRGGSTVLVARVNPRKDAVTSWKTYSPTSLLYGDNEQSLPLECFNPSQKFQWLSTLFSALGDVPVGNYLLRARDGNGQSTFGRKRGGVQVLMATESPVVDLYSFMPKTAPEGPASVVSTSNVAPEDSVLPSWNLRDRIPYTFQTGMYCVPFFLEGMCPNMNTEGSCDHMHLRLPEPRARSKKAKSQRWKFENYTKVLQKATRTNFEVLDCPVQVTLNYAFCGEDKAPSTSPTIADLHAPVHCPHPPGGCSLPHFSLHQILERLADDLLRQGRGKRRVQKNVYRQQRKNTERLNH